MLALFLYANLMVGAPNEELNSFMKDVWSPYCKGISLLECPSSQAQDLRDEIRANYEAGASIGEIRDYLRQRYGNQVRMEPEQSFRGSLAYLIPWLAFIIVSILVAVFWRRRSKFKADSEQKEIPLQNPNDPATSEVLKEIESRLQ